MYKKTIFVYQYCIHVPTFSFNTIIEFNLSGIVSVANKWAE